MNPRRRLMFAALCGLLLVAAVSGATAPHLVNYQGLLTNSGGQPVNGSFDITFSAYPDSSAPMALWSEQQAAVPVADGVFNVLLGRVADLPDVLFQKVLDGSLQRVDVVPGFKAPYADTADVARVSASRTRVTRSMSKAR